MSKRILTVFGGVLLACVMFAYAQAATITTGPLSISYEGDGPIFSEVNVAPGNEYVKILTVTNNGTVSHSFALATANVSGDLGDHIYIEPELYGVKLWSLTINSLANLPEESQTVLPSIDPGETVSLNLKARFDSAATSEKAGIKFSFDFIFGTQEAEPGASIAISDLTAGLTTAVGTGATGGGSPAVSATVTTSPSESGEVLGAKDNEERQGLNGLLLLIPAATLLLSFPFVSPGTRNAVLPTLGAGATAVLAFFTRGSMQPSIFWAILVAEIVLILVLDYLIVKKTVIEVLEEEEVLEKKARRAKSGRRK